MDRYDRRAGKVLNDWMEGVREEGEHVLIPGPLLGMLEWMIATALKSQAKHTRGTFGPARKVRR